MRQCGGLEQPVAARILQDVASVKVAKATIGNTTPQIELAKSTPQSPRTDARALRDIDHNSGFTLPREQRTKPYKSRMHGKDAGNPLPMLP